MKLPKWAAALDVVAVTMAMVALSVLTFGGFRLATLAGRLSVTDWTRPALWSVAALVIRHALVRRQPLPRHAAAAFTNWWRHPDTRLVLPVWVATRLGVLPVGFMAVKLVGLPASKWMTRLD